MNEEKCVPFRDGFLMHISMEGIRTKKSTSSVVNILVNDNSKVAILELLEDTFRKEGIDFEMDGNTFIVSGEVKRKTVYRRPCLFPKDFFE
jgi:hypothetical protein